MLTARLAGKSEKFSKGVPHIAGHFGLMLTARLTIFSLGHAEEKRLQDCIASFNARLTSALQSNNVRNWKACKNHIALLRWQSKFVFDYENFGQISLHEQEGR